MKLFAAGVSHKTAPVEIREQLAVQRNELVDLAHYLKWFGHLDEIVLLSTCNRVEIYGTTRQATGHIKSLLQLHCAEPRDLDPHIYLYEATLPCVICSALPPVWTRWCSGKRRSLVKSKMPTRSLAT